MENPKLIPVPFAANGDKNSIPEKHDSTLEANKATWETGFARITMIPAPAGGLPPLGQDFNGILYDISDNLVYASKGGKYKFSDEYAATIGGYPKGAVLQSDDETKEYQSLLDNNTVNFNTASSDDAGKSWRLIFTTDMLSAIDGKQPSGNYATKTELKAVENKIPSLMTESELKAGISLQPRSINAALLKIISSKGQYPFHSVNTSTTLTEDQAGVILIDASAGAIDITLPETKENIGFILKRIDSSLNTVKVKVSGTDKIKYNLLINANGYSFFNLFGAGDYWHVVSDGNGSWYDLNRADKTAIGTISYQSSIIAPMGGYVVANGSLLNRVDFPYLWDYAQKSGLLVDDSNFTGNEGCFSTGNGTSTFRVPDLRSTFLRVLDNDKGVDSGRTAGSWQKGSLSFVDTGSAGTWSSYDTTRTDPIDVALKKAGLDSFNPSDYPGIRMAGAGSPTVIDLPGTGLDFAYAGLSRPNNIAYPVYLKII